MHSYAHHLGGKKYKLGYDSEVCSTPREISITAINPKMDRMAGDPFEIAHYFKRKFERGATSKDVLETVKHPLVCLNQWGGQRILFVTPELTVVLTSEGALVTVWTRDDYDDGMIKLIEDAGY